MKKYEKFGYITGLLIGGFSWLFLIGWSLFELFNRIINKAGDPFPVLTTLFIISIMGKLTIINSDFRKIVDWINK
jgi:hypothetical protein